MSNLEKTVADIKSEIKVAADGKANITGRGLARLLDVSASLFSADKIPAKLAERLVQHGFEPADIGQGFPDTTVPVFAQYFAYESKAKSSQAAQVLLAFSAIGIRTWMQQVAGYEQPAPMTEIDKMRTAHEALGQMLKVYDYANNKPGLQNMVNHAIGVDGQPMLNGVVTLDDILARTGREYTTEEKCAIGMYAATQYRSLTGKAPDKLRVKRVSPSGNRQYYEVSSYPLDFVPIVENAIELGFNSNLC